MVQVVIAFLLIFTLSCADEEKSDFEDAKTVLTCSSATNCADNSAHGMTAYWHFFSSPSCALYTGAFGVASMKAQVSCNSGVCVASTNQFLNQAGGNISDPPTYIYQIYRYIDMNGNATPDTGEPASCSDAMSWVQDSRLDLVITGDAP